MHALHVCNWVKNEQLYPHAAVVSTACSENLQRPFAPVAENGSLLGEHSAVLLLVLVLLGCEFQTEQFPGPVLAYMWNESTRG